MKKTLLKLSCILLLLATLISCDDDTDYVKFYEYSVQIQPEKEITKLDLSGFTIVITNANTGNKQEAITDEKGVVTFTNLIGIYNISAILNKERAYEYIGSDGSTIYPGNAPFSGVGQSEILSNEKKTAKVTVYPRIEGKGWVIKEMYTASTRTVNGGSLRFDQFIEIYNNTDSVLYADGLTIGETRHQTSSGENIYEKDLNLKIFLHTVYSIPGKNGEKNVPVQPGHSLVIAPQPIDHRENNSIDLRPPISDYQWFDTFGSGEYSIDVPEVPNLERYFSYSLSVWVVTVQMNRGFVIFKIPEGKDMKKFVEENTDIRLNNAGNPVVSIGIPNEYIYDAVELGKKDKFYKKSMSAKLDVGFSYTVQSYNGKSIRRKISRIEAGGRIVYKDTNNSTEDFWTSRTPAPKQYPTNDEVSHE